MQQMAQGSGNQSFSYQLFRRKTQHATATMGTWFLKAVHSVIQFLWFKHVSPCKL